MNADDAREEVTLGCQILALMGQGDMIWGHVSVRDPHGRGVWLKAGGMGFEEITPHQVVLVGPKGELIEGDGRIHYEFPIHTELLAARPDCTAVVHTHAEAAVAFGATGMQLRPIGHEGSLFTPPNIERYTKTGDLIHTPEMGKSLAESLGERNAILLVNHGLVTVGKDIQTAVLTAIFLEKACRTQLAAASANGNLIWSNDEEALAKRERCYGEKQMDSAWKYLVRRLPAEGGYQRRDSLERAY